ncbi:sulfite exporter TauE/SafE family protein [Pedobacter sp. KR3-3]|uniref:Sulfite exporter TauE/SafE family protein n=1 Tax=Pedobacter albus TaxID=3113905 RepID=A0ABU7I532_9SPHI|nr:sulfite exporter TauE/SafE family protein [Pedobacter sp. KR3-3]MEE1944566.1 sulfite exporter TauE/SafE family protein [Pedobacter sp. KR3-3]
MSSLPLAFVLGLLGSLHCAVMCGPLMLSMPLQQQNWLTTAFQLVSYQLGRISVYGLLGLLVGLIGNSLKVFANQETLSLVVGFILISFALMQFSGRYMGHLASLQQRLLKPIGNLLGKFYGLPFWGFLVGMLNGLIPCGMVYLALATALNTGTPKDGAFFMLLFGLGTSPLMLTISMSKLFLRKYIRFNVNKYMPWFMLFLGTLMILRSADLGIAFLSPSVNAHSHGHVAECR